MSIIIPVYNAEKYIANCVNSLIKQTLSECEFIFINDGSEDNSEVILHDYLNRDCRIIILNQKNLGVSAARNAGLKVANGNYIGFVDADDHVEPNMFEKMYKEALAQKCDVIMSNLECEIEGEKMVVSPPFPKGKILHKEYIEDEVLPYFLLSDDLNSVCTKLYRRELIKRYNIEFPLGVALGEDSVFNMNFFSRASNCMLLDYTGYHYREVIGSATRNIVEKDYFNKAIEVYQQDIPEDIFKKSDWIKLKKYKAIRLIKSVQSYIHLYFAPSEDISLIRRYNYVKIMLKNELVRTSLPTYHKEYSKSIGKYEKVLLILIKLKFTVGLYGVTAYSRFRNR